VRLRDRTVKRAPSPPADAPPGLPGARARRGWYQLEERHPALLLGRAVAAVALAIAAAVAPLDMTARERWLAVAACAGALVLYGALAWLPRRWRRSLRVAVDASLVVDALLVLALAALSGGTESVALWLLPLLALGAALGLSLATGIKATLLSGLVVGALAAGETTGGDPAVDAVGPLVMAVAVVAVAGAAASVNERELKRQRQWIAALHEASDAFVRATDPDVLSRVAADAARLLLPGWSVELRLDGRLVEERAGREDGSVVLELPVRAARRGDEGEPGRALGALIARRPAPRVGGTALRVGQLQALRTLATELGVALVQLELIGKLEEMSLVDALTGLGNRRAFDRALEAELARARRVGRPVGLVLLDVDNFKRFNDEHGHQAGDAALTEVAVVIAATARVEDRACRVGGEEFALLLPGAGEADAAEVAERVRTGVEGRRLRFGPLTVSLGVAASDGELGGPELVAIADARLYEAKEGGRNRVVTGPDPRAPA
jgi:diguanylate cyclase (GGDEF)-like protein